MSKFIARRESENIIDFHMQFSCITFSHARIHISMQISLSSFSLFLLSDPSLILRS